MASQVSVAITLRSALLSYLIRQNGRTSDTAPEVVAGKLMLEGVTKVGGDENLVGTYARLRKKVHEPEEKRLNYEPPADLDERVRVFRNVLDTGPRKLRKDGLAVMMLELGIIAEQEDAVVVQEPYDRLPQM